MLGPSRRVARRTARRTVGAPVAAAPIAAATTTQRNQLPGRRPTAA